MSDKPTVAVVALSLTERGLSGGDVRLRAMLQRWDRAADLWCATSPSGRSNMESWGIQAKYLVSGAFPEALRSKSLVFESIAMLWFALTLALGRGRRKLPEPGIIYVQTDFIYEVWIGIVLQRQFPRARVVVLSHHSYREIYDLSGSFRHRVMLWQQSFTFRWIAQHADLVMVYDTVTGDIGERELLSSGTDPDRIVRMLNGVDLDAIGGGTDHEREFDACVIGLRKNKGLDDLVDVWKRVCARRPESTLYVIGAVSPADLASVRKSMAEFDLADSVTWGGHFSPPDLYREIRRCRICFAPTRQEPYGIAICEAMACGLPVVGYALANYERLHPGVVTTAPCYDQDALAETLVEILSSEDRVTSLGRVALEHVQRYDNDEIARSEWGRLLEVAAR